MSQGEPARRPRLSELPTFSPRLPPDHPDFKAYALTVMSDRQARIDLVRYLRQRVLERQQQPTPEVAPTPMGTTPESEHAP